jgi:hypothetical protein
MFLIRRSRRQRVVVMVAANAICHLALDCVWRAKEHRGEIVAHRSHSLRFHSNPQNRSGLAIHKAPKVLEISHDRRITFGGPLIDSIGGACDDDENYHEIPDGWCYRGGGGCDVDGAIGSGQEENASARDLHCTSALLDQLQRRFLQRVSLRHRWRMVSGRADADLPARQLRQRPQEVLTTLV